LTGFDHVKIRLRDARAFSKKNKHARESGGFFDGRIARGGFRKKGEAADAAAASVSRRRMM